MWRLDFVGAGVALDADEHWRLCDCYFVLETSFPMNYTTWAILD